MSSYRYRQIDDILQFVANDSISVFKQYNEFDWKQFIRICSDELVTTSIGWKISNTEFATVAPPDVCEYFDAFFEINRQRNLKGVYELEKLVACYNQFNITPMVLKGFAGIAGGVYPDAGYRVQADIDILVHPDQFTDAIKLAKEIGYQAQSINHENYFWKKDIHSVQEFPSMTSPDAVFPIDLHRRAAIFMHDGWDFEQTLRQHAIHRGNPRTEYLIPNLPCSLIYSICHSQVQDMDGWVGRISVRHLIDMLLFLRKLDDDARMDNFYYLLEKHRLHRYWQDISTILSAVNDDRRLKEATPLRYTFGYRFPAFATRVAAILRLVRATLRSPSRYLTIEFYRNLVEKISNNEIINRR